MSAFPRRAGVPTQSVGTRGAGAERGNEGRGKQKAFPRGAWERGKRGRAEDEGVPTQSVHGKEGIPTRSVGTRDPSDKCPAKAQNQNRFTTTPAVIAIWNRSWEMSLTFRMRAKRSNFSGTMIVSPGSSLVLEPLEISQR